MFEHCRSHVVTVLYQLESNNLFEHMALENTVEAAMATAAASAGAEAPPGVEAPPVPVAPTGAPRVPCCCK